MKTFIAVLSMVLLLGSAPLSLAGNNPANPYKSKATFATTPSPVKVNPWHEGVLSKTGSLVVPKPFYDTCPVMGHKITSKHNATIALSNGKYMEVCCSPCKETIEKDLAKYKVFQY